MLNRRPFQGVLNILSFNRHFYFFGFASLAILFLSRYLVVWPSWLFIGVILAFSYGLIMPLLVSAYVYDLSGFYSFKWLKDIFQNPEQIKSLINVNAGFDETSFILQDKFKGAHLEVFDFYDDSKHTEPAIIRARKVTQEFPNTKQISSDCIPKKDHSVDAVFLISAIHEMRSLDEKISFLKECHRIAKSGSTIVLVEHLRDWPNFLAFTIGFTHFFSSNHWKKAFLEAGLKDITEEKFTLFMSIFTAKVS